MRPLLLSLIIIGLIGCKQQTKFERNEWNAQTDPAFPPDSRTRMLNDLTSNYKLKGLRYSELNNLLGYPDYKDSSSVVYKILVDYGSDIDPVHTKDLIFNYSKDSIITSFKVAEWTKKSD